jgi:putative MATE family efflux protein
MRLALPILASYLLRIGHQWVDALWVRGLGVEATAAVTTSIFVVWFVGSLNDIFAVGVTAYVSQLLGANQRRRAGLAAFRAIRASAVTGLGVAAFGYYGARWVFLLMSTDEKVVERGDSYLSVILMGAPLLLTAVTCQWVMRAAGDSKTPLKIDLVAMSLNAILDPILIYGWGPVPALGVAGAAWATVTAHATMVAGYILMALRRHRALPLARSAEGSPVRLLGMARVGIPAGLIGILFSVVYVSFARSAARFGAASMAVLGIANRIEAFQFVSSMAIGAAGAAMIGQNLGAGRPDRAAAVLRTGVMWALGLASVLTALFVAIPGFFLSLFTRDAEALALGVPYLRILAIGLAFTGVEVVVAEAIFGSGHTRVMSWIYTGFSLVRIPLAFLVPDWTGLGVLGIAWLISGTSILRTVLIVGWAARGTWKTGLHRELHEPEPPAPEPPEAV